MPDEFEQGLGIDNLKEIRLPSGAPFYVHKREVSYTEELAKDYLKDNKFTNISDLQDVDRLIITELLVWRWGLWVSSGRDYYNDPIDEQAWQKAINQHSGEIRQLKKSLGLDKETRDKLRGEGSVDDYLNKLRVRAQEFGVMRNMQAAKAIELFLQLQALITLWNNTTPKEKKDQHITTDELMDWIQNTAIPEFKAIDEEFRKTSQQYWIQEQ